MAQKNSKKVLIKWKTQDVWLDKEQPMPRSSIKPLNGPLTKGQSVQVKFSKHWYPAEVSKEWTDEKSTEQSKSAD